MTRDKLVDAVMRRLSGRKETSNRLRNFIIDELQVLIFDVLEQEPVLPWFLLEEKTLTTTAAQEYVDLDTDYILTWEEGGFFFQKTEGGERELKIGDWDDIRSLYIGITDATLLNNEPREGSVIGTRLYMRPTPDAVYTIKYWQYGSDTAIDISGTYGDANSGNENLWMKNASDLLINEVGAIAAATIIKDQEAAQNLTALASRARKRLMDRNIIKQEELKYRYMENE